MKWQGTCIFPHGATAASEPGPPHYRGFTITLRHTTLGRTPLDEWSARRRDLYQTTRNTHKRQTSIPPAGFEPAIPASYRPQTHALDRVATRINIHAYNPINSKYRPIKLIETRWWKEGSSLSCLLSIMWRCRDDTESILCCTVFWLQKIEIVHKVVCEMLCSWIFLLYQLQN
jgi:hypothetical protein